MNKQSKFCCISFPPSPDLSHPGRGASFISLPYNKDISMDIREIRSDKIDKLIGLYTHLHDNDTIPEPHVISKVWHEIQKNKNIKYFGVFEGDELISSCAIITVPNLTRSCRPYAVIENVVTRTSHRKRGYGKAALKAANMPGKTGVTRLCS
jgi:hypothetical protein